MAKKVTSMAGLMNTGDAARDPNDDTAAGPALGATSRDVAGADPVSVPTPAPAPIAAPASTAKANLNFKVDADFKKKFKLLALRKGLNLTELLELAISNLENADKTTK